MQPKPPHTVKILILKRNAGPVHYKFIIPSVIRAGSGNIAAVAPCDIACRSAAVYVRPEIEIGVALCPVELGKRNSQFEIKIGRASGREREFGLV